jgi:hypothetical protein
MNKFEKLAAAMREAVAKAEESEKNPTEKNFNEGNKDKVERKKDKNHDHQKTHWLQEWERATEESEDWRYEQRKKLTN